MSLVKFCREFYFNASCLGTYTKTIKIERNNESHNKSNVVKKTEDIQTEKNNTVQSDETKA